MEKNTLKKVLKTTIALTLIAALLATTTQASLQVTTAAQGDPYCPPTVATFKAIAKLTECEELKTATIKIGDKTCSLPKMFGEYPNYGNCALDKVTVTETNPSNCYTYGGTNIIEYTIRYKLTPEWAQKEHKLQFYIQDYQGKEASKNTTFRIYCETPTTSTTTTTTTTTTICENCSTTTTTCCPICTTTTTRAKKKSSGGDGSYPAKPAKTIASCSDKIKNFGETDVDCGGELCPPCEDGKRCSKNTDCVNLCILGICRTPSCSDGIQDQDETDVDCGGKTCDKCEDGRKCIVNEDCESNYCENGICKPETTCKLAEPNCTDNIRNQDETDIDCGGTSCKKCEDFMKCSGDMDCVSGYCENHVCKTPTCSDGVKNQGEEDIDCGGPCSACKQGGGLGVIGYVTAIAGGLANILMILIILLLLGILGMYLTRRRKYVAAADYLESITDDAELDKFINKNRPAVTASTSRKVRRIKKYLDDGKIDIVWIKDWDYINELILRGLDDNNAESIALAKQMNAGLFTKSEEAKKIAEEEGLKVYST